MAEPVVVNSVQVMTQAIAEMDKLLLKHGWRRCEEITLRQDVNGYGVKIEIDTSEE